MLCLNSENLSTIFCSLMLPEKSKCCLSILINMENFKKVTVDNIMYLINFYCAAESLKFKKSRRSS